MASDVEEYDSDIDVNEEEELLSRVLREQGETEGGGGARDVITELGYVRRSAYASDRDKDPRHRFYLAVEAVSYQLNTDDVFSVDADRIRSVLDEIATIPSAQFMNPTSFVVGYFLTEGGRIDDAEFNRVVGARLRDASVRPEDILRYCRMWLLRRGDGSATTTT